MNPFGFQFFNTGEGIWEAMQGAMREAKHSIDIEHYIFVADDIGNKFLEILKEKSRQGVKVRLLLDAVGSYFLYTSSLPDELRQAGIEVKFFNPISPWRIHNFTAWFFRDHNKIIVVDRKVGFAGGIGIRHDMATWRDTNARLEGEVVEEMQKVFDETWNQLGKQTLLSRIKKFRTDAKKKFFITNIPYFKKRFLYHSFIDALRGAQKSIWLTTPYFIPDRRLLRVLRLAVRRGVDVRVIVPKFFDVLAVGTASESSFEEVLKSGVRIFRYEPVFLHAKTAVVDDAWSTFGSFNLDSLSFVYNFEGNVVTTDPQCASLLREQFMEDLKNSKEVILEEWRKRPFINKLREFFITPIRGFM